LKADRNKGSCRFSRRIRVTGKICAYQGKRVDRRRTNPIEGDGFKLRSLTPAGEPEFYWLEHGSAACCAMRYPAGLKPTTSGSLKNGERGGTRHEQGAGGRGSLDGHPHRLRPVLPALPWKSRNRRPRSTSNHGLRPWGGNDLITKRAGCT